MTYTHTQIEKHMIISHKNSMFHEKNAFESISAL